MRNFYSKSLLILTSLLAMFVGDIYAQFDQRGGQRHPSSDSRSMIKSTTTQVNLYTGVPMINADLHTLKGRQYTIPIALSYNASGVKVQDVASNVGLGWSLNVNSSVTRIVKGRPDEETNTGYFGSSMGLRITGTLTQSAMDSIASNQKDSEPDVFYYNIHGISGKFVFDKDKNPMMLENSNIKILNSPFKNELGIDAWVFCDDLGNRFYFGGNTSTTETTRSTSYFDNGSEAIEFVSSWFMDKIETTNKTETINFNYVSGNPTKVIFYSKKMRMRNKIVRTLRREVSIFMIRVQKASVEEDISVIDQAYWDSNTEEEILNPKYLASINTSAQTAIFTYDDVARADLENGKVLKKIEVRNYEGSTLHHYNLVYSYMISTDYNQNETIRSYDKFRLKLDSILLVSTESNITPQYRFVYNNLVLPPRSSSKTDSWGYYNNNMHGYFPADELVAESKQVDTLKKQAGILQKIIYPTGGWKEYYFESNQYNEVSSTHNGGGLRIKKSVEVSGASNEPIVSKFVYKDKNGLSTGKKTRSNPIFDTHIDHTLPTVSYPIGRVSSSIPVVPPGSRPPAPFIDPIGSYIPPNFSPVSPNVQYNWLLEHLIGEIYRAFIDLKPVVSEVYSPFVVSSSTPYNELNDLDNCSIGYSEVTVENMGNGKIVNTYTDVGDFPDEVAQFRVNNQFKSLYVLYPNVRPFTPFTSYAFARGRLKESIVYDRNGHLIQRTTNKYTYTNFNKSILGFKCALGKVEPVGNGWQGSNSYYHIGYYYYNSYALKTVETEDLRQSVATEEKFDYNVSYPYSLVKTTKTNSDHTVVTTDFKYVAQKDQVNYNDSYQQLAANKLYDELCHGVLLESIVKRDGIVLNWNKTAFKIFNKTSNSISRTLVLPEILYNDKNNTSKIAIHFLDYDFFGNVTEVVNNRTSTVKKWGYNNLFGVAEVKNASSGEVYFEDFEELSNSNVLSGNAFSGRKYLSGDFYVSFNNINQDYKMSYRYLESGIWKFSGYMPYTGPVTITQGDAIDDITVIPSTAHMTSYSYDPLNGTKSEKGISGLTYFYEYDDFHRVKLIKDENGDILKHMAYHQSNDIAPNVYINRELKILLYKQCIQGSGPFTYVVEEGKYHSYVSQQDADSKAQADIVSKGQEFVNVNGRCKGYAMLVFSNIHYVSDGYYDKEVADVHLKLFADVNGTSSMLSSEDMEVRLGIEYLWSNGFDESTTDNYFDYITMPQGISSLSLGTWELRGTHDYYDPIYQNNFEEGFKYSYTILVNGEQLYIPVN